MKRYILLFFLTIQLLGCKKEPASLFDLPYELTFEIPAGLNTFETHYFDITGIRTNAEDLLSANNAEESDLLAVQAKTARLLSTFVDLDLDFIQEISVRVFEDDPNAFHEVFFRDNVPFDSGDFIDLIPALPDVKEFLLDESYNLSIRMEFRQPPPTFVTVRLDFDFFAR